jgi:hypothetical protein
VETSTIKEQSILVVSVIANGFKILSGIGEGFCRSAKPDRKQLGSPTSWVTPTENKKQPMFPRHQARILNCLSSNSYGQHIYNLDLLPTYIAFRDNSYDQLILKCSNSNPL